jgi:hypothetical protein
MIVAGHQPNYLPWLGFFDKMSKCDIFIIEDVVQFVSQEFQNRNRIKTPKGVNWLTVPVRKGRKRQVISEVQIANEKDWSKQHWLMLKSCYARSPYWKEYCDFFDETYCRKWTRLIDLNLHLIRGVMNFLGINKELVMASSLGVSGKKNDLIVAQCKALGADTLLSGTGALNYLDLERFEKEGIKVIFQEFKYPVYPQLWGSFVPDLSVIDYIFCTGGKV